MKPAIALVSLSATELTDTEAINAAVRRISIAVNRAGLI